MRRLASREGLLHPDPSQRLPLLQLLATVGGLDVDDSEASLPALNPKAQGPTPMRVRAQQSLGRVGSLPSSIKKGPESIHHPPHSVAADPNTCAPPLRPPVVGSVAARAAAARAAAARAAAARAAVARAAARAVEN